MKYYPEEVCEALGGPDTSRVVNFQYACAISHILDFPQQPHWHTVQLEGDEDIEHILIFDDNGDVQLRAQVKQKEDPLQWKPWKLQEILLAFSKCQDSEKTRACYEL